jgi:NAD-dependent DNA ligase
MTREELERLLRISGAQIDKCVMPHTNLLIVGRKRSSGWKYENFGTKIRDAVNLKSRGHSILMLSEKSILRTLSSIQPSIGQNDHASWSEKLEEKILGLGILHVGATAARELAAYFRDLDKLRVASLDELIEVPGIGDKTAASILDWFQNAANQALIGSFVYPGVNFGESAHQKPVNCAFEGTSWVVTGTLSESREVFKELIQEGSGHVSNNISDTTTHLLVGERPGSKLKKAKGLGVKIIDESAFDEMLSPEP